MDHSDRAHRCPRCGADLPSSALEGVCPACRRAVGSVPVSDVTGEESTIPPPSGAALPARGESPRLAPGQRFGAYRIERLLGRGGMGEVYEAEHLEQGRRVALKVFSERLTDPAHRTRFLREGQLAASISHPHSVYIFGSEEVNGIPVIAMELLPGGTLRDRVERDGPLPPAQAVDAILQIIAGLDAAQAAGILHRDVKPSNCFIDNAGTMKVGDFGLSISTQARDVTRLTIAGTFQGTPEFAAPEQLRGEPLDVRADIYAVGATLYYLLTGKPPFDARDLMELVTRVATEAPRSPREVQPRVPRGLAAIVLGCLAKDRAHRPASYAVLDDQLRPFSSAAPTPATLGLRFLAGIIDETVLAVLFFPLTLTMISPSGVRQVGWLSLVRFVVQLAYFGILEGCWGASIGKQGCGLRVTGPDGQLPGLARALSRAFIFKTPNMVVALLAELIGANGIRQLMAEYPLAGPLAGVAVGTLVPLLPGLLFSTARRRNGFAGVHEIATGTRVAERATRVERPAIEAAVARVAPAGTSVRRYGPFDVTGALGATDSGELLVGFDPRLRRPVWIHVMSPGTPALTPLDRDLSRPGRLRWLSGRRATGEAWDAYEALDGAAFVRLLGQPQPWRSVRYWLLDLAREIDAGLREGSLPTLAFDHVWISRDGHARLLDFKAPGVPSTPPPDAPATFATAQAWLGALARSALDGVTAGADTGSAARREPRPLSTKPLLASLAGHAFAGPQGLITRMAGLANGADHVERWRRATQIAMCGLPTVVMTLSLTVIEPFMTQRMFTPEQRDLELYMMDLSTIPSNAGGRTERRRQALEVYVAGRFGSMISDARVSPNPRTTAVPGPFRAEVERIVAAHSSVSQEEMARATAEIAPLIEMRRRAATPMSSRALPLVMVFYLFTAFFGLLSALIFKGGWLLRAFGIAVVNRRGDEVSRLRAFWRALVAWSPVLALYAVSFHGRRPFSWAVVLALGVFVSGAVWAVLRPERGWQDRLAGTWLVPR